jgi:hypothetical protein
MKKRHISKTTLKAFDLYKLNITSTHPVRFWNWEIEKKKSMSEP